MPARTCADCTFFVPHDPGAPPHGEVEEAHGSCRRNAPVPVHVTVNEEPIVGWPTVCELDWCGEFKGRRA